MAELDKYNMYQVLKDFPKQFEKGLEIASNVKVNGDFERVVISGMGGSALPGDILNDYLETKIPIIVNKDYSLPPGIDSDALVFISSYSGNTEETLSVFEEVKKRRMKIIGFCSGGRLEEFCKANRIPLVKYPRESPGFQPRFALGYAFSSMCRVLYNCGIINDESENIRKCAQSLRNLNLEPEGKKIAKRLKGRIPIIYSSEGFKSLVYVIKTKFNENSKIMAFCNRFPELNHNEMVGYTNSKKQGRFHIIMLKEETDHPRVRKSMDVTGKLIKSKGGEVTLINLMGENLLTRMFSVLYLFDWVSYYLALECKTDPTPIEMVEELKKKLKMYKQ